MQTVRFGGIAAALLLLGAAGAQAASSDLRAFALGDGGTSLIGLGDPHRGDAPTRTALTDATGAALQLHGIAYRPETGGYFGYSSATGTVYALNTVTGVGTAQTGGGMTSSGALGFDFNNVLDAARIVTTNDENRVFFPSGHPGRPSAPEIVAVTDLAYVAGDANEGVDPQVFANAYTNAVPFPSATTQYVLDAQTDSLATLGNNAGTLETVGRIVVDGQALDFSAFGGMDIVSYAEGDNSAYAMLSTTEGSALYALSLFADGDGTVAATRIADYGISFGVITGFAAQPADVPVPAAGLLLLTGLVGAGAIARRKTA